MGSAENRSNTSIGLPRPVTIEKRKWDGQVSGRWRALLVDDGPDRWVWFIPAGTCHERPWRDRAARTDVDQMVVGGPEPWLLTVALDAGGTPTSGEVDAITGVHREGDDLVTFVDLDIDLELDLATRATALRDDDQFRSRRVQMGYPLAVQRTAWRGLGRVSERFRSGRWPFGPALGALAAESLRAWAAYRATGDLGDGPCPPGDPGDPTYGVRPA